MSLDVVISFDAPPMHGGAHTWLYEVYRRWPSPACFITAHDSGDPGSTEGDAQFVRRELIRCHDFSFLSPRFLGACLRNAIRIRRLVGPQPGSRLHALRAFPEGLLGVLTKSIVPSAQLVTYVHGEEILVAQSSRQLSFMAKTVYESSQLVIANSESTRRLVRGFCPRARVAVVHPGVDVLAITNAMGCGRVQLRERLGWPKESVVVLTIGRMEPRKNHEAVIRAVSRLRELGVSIHHVCVGDGPLREYLRAVTRQIGAQSFVSFTGAVDADTKYQMLAASDIFAMPSIEHGEMLEGFGIVFLEAACAGVPSVAGNSGGQREAVLEGKTGLIVDGANEDQLVEAIGRLSADHQLRSELGRKARSWAEEHDWSSVLARTLSVLGHIDG